MLITNGETGAHPGITVLYSKPDDHAEEKPAVFLIHLSALFGNKIHNGFLAQFLARLPADFSKEHLHCSAIQTADRGGFYFSVEMRPVSSEEAAKGLARRLASLFRECIGIEPRIHVCATFEAARQHVRKTTLPCTTSCAPV